MTTATHSRRAELRRQWRGFCQIHGFIPFRQWVSPEGQETQAILDDPDAMAAIREAEAESSDDLSVSATARQAVRADQLRVGDYLPDSKTTILSVTKRGLSIPSGKVEVVCLNSPGESGDSVV